MDLLDTLGEVFNEYGAMPIAVGIVGINPWTADCDVRCLATLEGAWSVECAFRYGILNGVLHVFYSKC